MTRTNCLIIYFRVPKHALLMYNQYLDNPYFRKIYSFKNSDFEIKYKQIYRNRFVRVLMVVS